MPAISDNQTNYCTDSRDIRHENPKKRRKELFLQKTFLNAAFPHQRKVDIVIKVMKIEERSFAIKENLFEQQMKKFHLSMK